ncbi:MAG: peptidase C45, partial [Catenulispora sp.]|nr:peptidase C45 [Catenulispora sp.]
MIAYVRASGSPFQVGRAHGAARRDTLQAFLADGHARLDHLLPAPVDPRLVDEYAQVVRQALPDLAEEISGLAVGAGIHEHDAFLLQVRRELLGYSKIPARGDCTTYARAGEVLAQTVDLNGNLDDVIGVLDVERDGRRALILTFGGLLGYLGVNSAGLAVGLNLVLGGDWRPGVPPYLAIRHLLDQASSVDEAVKILAGLPLASSRSIMLCDATSAGYAEILDGDVRFVPGAESVHTNH